MNEPLLLISPLEQSNPALGELDNEEGRERGERLLSTTSMSSVALGSGLDSEFRHPGSRSNSTNDDISISKDVATEPKSSIWSRLTLGFSSGDTEKQPDGENDFNQRYTSFSTHGTAALPTMKMNGTAVQDATLENVDAFDLHLDEEKNGDVTNGSSGTKRPISKDLEEEQVRDDCSFFYTNANDDTYGKARQQQLNGDNSVAGRSISSRGRPKRRLNERKQKIPEKPTSFWRWGGFGRKRSDAASNTNSSSLNNRLWLDFSDHDDDDDDSAQTKWTASKQPPPDLRGGMGLSDFRNSSLYDISRDGKVQLRLPTDNVRLVMDPQLEPGILSLVMDDDYQNYNAKSSNIHNVNYILTVDDDLYRRVVHEISDSERCPLGLYYCCHQEEYGGEEKVSIYVAVAILSVLFLFLLVNTLIWPVS